MGFEIYSTENFDRLFLGLTLSEQDWIRKLSKNLKVNVTGKVLRFSWFREKKYLNKRLYFFINEKSKKILFVAFSTKKDQQKVINQILENKKEYLELLNTL